MRSFLILMASLATLSCATGTPAASGDVASEAQSAQGAQAVALVRGLANGDFAAVSAAFAPEARIQFSEGRLRETWHQVAGDYGDLTGTGDPIPSSQQGYAAYRIPLKFQRGSLHARVVFGPQGVVGLFFVP